MGIDVKKIRQDFPLLQDNINKQKIVYFDSACQSLRPLSVIEAINKYYREYPACAGRSAHKLGDIVTNKVDESRHIIAKFIGAKTKKEIVFTKNTTESINLIANSFSLKKGDVVISSDKEHNSNLIPWQILVKKIGIVHKVVPSKEDNTFDLEAFKDMMDENVKLVAMVFTSNLDGVNNPVKEIIKIAHKFQAKVILDAAQAVAHQEINVSKLDVDFLAFSGHKILGPSGTGILYGKYALLEQLKPFLVGGSTVESSSYETHNFFAPPEKFEAGLQDYAGIIGLGEAIKYIKKLGFSNIAKQELSLNEYISNNLQKIPGLNIIGPNNPSLRSGVLSFFIEGKDSHEIALLLNQTADIMLRSGRFCVHSWFNSRNIKSAIRASFSFYNNREEADIFISTLNKINKII